LSGTPKTFWISSRVVAPFNFLSASTPRRIKRVASPPSSTMRFGPCPFSQEIQSRVRFQYSSKVYPFQAKTFAVPAWAIAAAAWSWVE
jgi:hypothetical protein